MGLNIARLKSWFGFENISSVDLNNEFNNLIQKTGADVISSANSTNGTSPTVAAMQATANPGGIGSENLALTLQEDVRQLRYQLNAIIGGAQWYSAPNTSLALLNSSVSAISAFPQSRISSGRISAAVTSTNQPMFLVPAGSAATVTLKATTTNLVGYFNNVLQTISADISVTSLGLQVAGKTCLVNDALQTGQQSSKTLGERGTRILIDTTDAAITALNGTYAAFKHSTEYFIAYIDTATNSLIDCFRGVGFDSNDAWLARTAMSNNDTITLCKLTYVFATYNSSTPGLTITYNQPKVAYVQPAGAAIGDYWYDTGNSTWKIYNGTTFTATAANFAGVCIQDNANCVAARSADFFKPYSIMNTVELESNTIADVRATKVNSRVSVYGNSFYFIESQPDWNTLTSMDTGLTIAASTTYYCYVTDLCDYIISNVRPSERKFDLLGAYHPAKPWRCVGQFQTDGAASITPASVNIAYDHQLALPDGVITPTALSGDNYPTGWVFGNTVTAPSIVSVTTIAAGSSMSAGTTVAIGTAPNVSTLITGATGLAFQAKTGVIYPGTTVGGGFYSGEVPKLMYLVAGSGGAVRTIVTSGGAPGSCLVILRGAVSNSGAILTSSSEGFTIVRNSSGQFTINFTVAFTTLPSVVVSSHLNPANIHASTNGAGAVTTTYALVSVTDPGAGYYDGGFAFIAMGQW